MADESASQQSQPIAGSQQTQQPQRRNTGGRNGGRGVKKAPPVSTGTDGTSANANTSRPRGNSTKRGSPKVPVDDISRPSSTDGNRSNSGGNRGRGRGNSTTRNKGRQNSGNNPRPAPPTAPATNPSQASTNIPAAPQPVNTAQSGSAALSNLQRVITDLKSFPANGPNTTASQVPGSALASSAINAAVFQPGAGVYPPPNPTTEIPRQRKSAANQHMGTSGAGFSSYASPLNSFAPGLGAMPEDEDEDGIPHDDADARNIQQSTIGSYQPPRFAAQALSQQPSSEAEALGPSGRPQLAPGFMFGQRRPVPPGGEDDANFQFPQQSQQAPMETGPTRSDAHRRTPSGAHLMAEQIAIQQQIEALQQQQQQLLQQQIATNSVMSSFANTAPTRGGNVHRRIQSQQMGLPAANFNGLGTFGLGGAVGLGPQPTDPKGHNRRHSMNVINKAAEQGAAAATLNAASLYNNNQLDGFDDGFAPPLPGGHSRQQSRADTGWRGNGQGQGGQNNYAADLAQAQAQLASLSQFRAASGGHHQKMPSFSFPNLLPNVMAANMMGLNTYNLLQQQQQFQMQLQQNQGPQRKSLFAPYLPQASLPPLLAAGKLVVGILRVNKRNRSDAYISTEVLDSDIYICGSKDRNRALEGDIVAVELLDVDEVWGTKKEKEEKKRKKEENAAYDHRAITGRKNDKKKDDVEVEGQGLMLFEDEEVTDDVKPQYAGHVVAVVERMPGQLFSGTLGLLRPSSAATKEKQEAERRERGVEEEPPKQMERPKIVWFKPTDKRVPLIAIPTEQAPPDFVNNSEAYVNRLFVACIKRHPISSLHPFGTLVEELGNIGDPEVETSALLKDCNFPTEEFTDSVLKCIPPAPWTIPERELEVRRDLRTERIFTIDPNNAKDLDDALSISDNGDGTLSVGVHIADVSFFVRPNTAIDRDARKRATSVYLVQRAVPMLPPQLSEEISSLLPGQERLAFSVIFTLTSEGRIVSKWYGRTIIKSATKLSYSDAQDVIEGKPLGNIEIFDHAASDIQEDIKKLQSLATFLREQRFKDGALKLGSTKLTFTLDDDNAPSDCAPYEQKEANGMVEEFMLLANMAVAQQIAAALPEQAMLRRHDTPIDRRLALFAERAKRMGYHIDVSTAGAIQKSLEEVRDPKIRRILEMLATKAMTRAKYFCAGMLDIAKYGHYALSSPLYTHFTSPIRRYSDIIVHRQLEAVLNSTNEVKFNMDRDAVAKIAQQCNMKKDSAKLAQEQSTHLFLCLLISDLTNRYGPVIRQARVVGVLDAAFDVFVPEFGIEKRVHVDQMPIENHIYDEHSHTLQIYWSDKDVITWLAENSDDEHLKTVKRNAEHHASKMEVTSLSVHDESALFEEDEEEDEIVLNRTQDAVHPKLKDGKLDSSGSKQRAISAAKVAPEFEGLRTAAGGQPIQDIRELMTVPVIVTADLTKSPPVIKVYSVNPYAKHK